MSRTKVLISILTVLILIVLSGVSVWAAPNRQDIIGDVQDIQIAPWVNPDTGETITTVLVTLTVDGETQTVRVSVDTAKDLELLQVDGNGDLVLDPDSGDPIPILIDPDNPPTVEIDPGDVIGDGEEEGEEPLTEHPVASALAAFFDTRLGLEEGAIMGYHEDGFGFGVIAHACWIASMLKPEGENNTEAGDILDAILAAKKSGDFSSLTLSEDGETPIVTLPNGETPKNWGQFKKAVLKSGKVQKNLANLGAIMSERAEPPGGTDSGDQGELGATSTEGKVKGKKDQAGGKPDAPPGQEKNKDKGKGGGKKK